MWCMGWQLVHTSFHIESVHAVLFRIKGERNKTTKFGNVFLCLESPSVTCGISANSVISLELLVLLWDLISFSKLLFAIWALSESKHIKSGALSSHLLKQRRAYKSVFFFMTMTFRSNFFFFFLQIPPSLKCLMEQRA